MNCKVPEAGHKESRGCGVHTPGTNTTSLSAYTWMHTHGHTGIYIHLFPSTGERGRRSPSVFALTDFAYERREVFCAGTEEDVEGRATFHSMQKEGEDPQQAH